MKFGISEKSYNLILSVLKNHPEIDEVIIFGSRVLGNYKNGSDIDIALKGEELTSSLVDKIKIELNETLPIPYYLDVVDYNSISNRELKEHIDRFGKKISL